LIGSKLGNMTILLTIRIGENESRRDTCISEV